MEVETSDDADVLCYALEHASTADNSPDVLNLIGVKTTVLKTSNTKRICNAIAKNKSLKSFDWTGAKIGDEVAKLIARAFSKHCGLEELCLHKNDIGDSGVGELATMMKANNSIKVLLLSHNKFGDAGAKVLAEALAQNEHVKEVLVEGNGFEEFGLGCFVEALLQNNNCEITSREFTTGRWPGRRIDRPVTSAMHYLSKINRSKWPTETKAFMKFVMIKKSSENQWWYHSIGTDVASKILMTALKDTDDSILRQMMFKRKEIDLSGDDNIEVEPDGTGVAIQNQIMQRDEYDRKLKKVKIEKDATEDALAEAKEDIEDGHELAQQQSLFIDKWQTKFDDLAKLAEEAGLCPQKINEIRYRS